MITDRLDIPSPRFNEWWDSNEYNQANPFEKGSAAYWAFEGWHAALHYEMLKLRDKK